MAQSIRMWREHLLQAGYTLNMVNYLTSALNTYLVYIGYPDWCVPRLRANGKQRQRKGMKTCD